MKKLLPALALLAIAGCSQSSSPFTGIEAPGTMNVRLTDAPAALDAVNFTVVEVSAHRTNDDTWEVIAAAPTDVELLSLRNGVFEDLGATTLPAGTYDQIRLVLADGATVTVDGTTHPLATPSATTSGLKVFGAFTVPPGANVEVQLDLDAGRAVREENGSWWLHPVLRGLSAVDAGSIGGEIDPPGGTVDVFALSGSDTIATARPEADGSFVMSVLPGGDYDVMIVPRDEDGGRPTRVIRSVDVAGGVRTELGEISLRPGRVIKVPGQIGD